MFAREVNSDESMKNVLKDALLYKVNGEKGGGPALVEKYGVVGWPTYVVLNGDGEVTASDALKVINFLELHGAMSLVELETGASVTAEAESTSEDPMISLRRNDTNRDGQISPLDALIVINSLQRQSLESGTDDAETSDMEQTSNVSLQAGIAVISLQDDDDEELA